VSALLVAALVGAAVLLAVPGRGRAAARLERLVGPAAGPGRPPGAGGVTVRRLVDAVPRRREAVRAGAAAGADLAQLAVLLRAGPAAPTAWRHLVEACGPGPAGAWAAAAAATVRGEPCAPALRARLAGLDDATGRRAVAAAAASVEVCERTGAPPALVLRRLAAALREDADADDARAAALAAPRATARVLLALPLVGLVLGTLAGAAPLAVLTGTPLGRACAAGGLVLAGAGLLWVRRLVATARRPPSP